MKFIKFLLALLIAGVSVWLIFWLIGVIYSGLWLLFWAGLIGVGGYAGYKVFLENDGKDEPKKLEEKTPIAIADLKDADRALEEYKRKYLPK